MTTWSFLTQPTKRRKSELEDWDPRRPRLGALWLPHHVVGQLWNDFQASPSEIQRTRAIPKCTPDESGQANSLPRPPLQHYSKSLYD